MDCEKFESILLDELYEELDEVTSAAAKRHVAGCARCAALFSGLKATRRLAVMPVVEPPADLEDRILAAAKEAQKVVPIGRRVSHVISLAGSWAMRPQTAMAALFLLMIGSSALLIKGKVAKPASSTMIVSEQGEPVASTPLENLLPAAAPAVDAVNLGKDAKGAATAPAATAAASSAPTWNGYASNDVPSEAPAVRGVRAKAADADKTRNLDDLESSGGARAGGGGGAPAPQAHYGGLGHASSAPAAANAPPPPAAPAMQALGALGGAKKEEDGALAQQKPQAPPTDFDTAMNAYNTGDYATSTQLWDKGAQNGDLNAALWEARSIREASGCGVAAARFDRVAQQAGVSAVANDAKFDAARCYRALGQYDVARALLSQLILVPAYFNRAQSELNSMGPKASAKARAAAGQSAPQQQQQQAPAAGAPPPAASPPASSANTY